MFESAAELELFLLDFGVPCVAGGTPFTATLDQPDELLNLPRAAVHTRQYELLYRTAAVSLVRELPVTVNGQAFTVREAPRQIDDGAFSRVLVSKA